MIPFPLRVDYSLIFYGKIFYSFFFENYFSEILLS